MLASRVATEYALRLEVRAVASELRRVRRASRQAAWAQEDVLWVVATHGFDLEAGLMDLWEKAKGRLSKFKKLFSQAPQLLEALRDLIGEVTPQSVKKLLDKGKAALKNVFSHLHKALTTPSGLPTLTDLAKRTELAAKIGHHFQDKVEPRARTLDAWLEQHVPRLRRVSYAGAFIFIWLNVDELSWEWSDLYRGFTGQYDLVELLTTLPESTVGFISNILFGIGYVIMPFALLLRILTYSMNHWIKWEGGQWVPSTEVITREEWAAAGVRL